MGRKRPADDNDSKPRKQRMRVENPAGFQPSPLMYANIRAQLNLRSDAEAHAWFKSLSVLEKERAEDLYDSATAINRIKASYRSALQIPDMYGEPGTDSAGKIWAEEVAGLNRKEIYKVYAAHYRDVKKLKKKMAMEGATTVAQVVPPPPRKRMKATNSSHPDPRRSAAADQKVRDRRAIEGVKGLKGLRTLIDSKMRKVSRDLRGLCNIVGRKEGCEMEVTAIVRMNGLPFNLGSLNHQHGYSNQHGGSNLKLPETNITYQLLNEKSGLRHEDFLERTIYTPDQAARRQNASLGRVSQVLTEFLEFQTKDSARDVTKYHSAVQAGLEADAPKKKHPRPGPRFKGVGGPRLPLDD